jgi:hypothetical protein
MICLRIANIATAWIGGWLVDGFLRFVPANIALIQPGLDKSGRGATAAARQAGYRLFFGKAGTAALWALAL